MTITCEKIIDLSVPIEMTPSERVPVCIRYVRHEEGAGEMCRIFGVRREDLPQSGGWAAEEVHLITHAGTHVDAPWHYGPRSCGQTAPTIDAVALDWFLGPGILIDVQHKEAASEITVEDLRLALDKTGGPLAPGTIVVLNTGAHRYWGLPEYPEHGAGLTAAAVLWLCNQGVRVIGTDAFSLDAPFEIMRQRFAATGNPRAIWPAHFAGRDVPYCQIEKLTNLDRLPLMGFWVACFPVKISNASAAWTRAVALVP